MFFQTSVLDTTASVVQNRLLVLVELLVTLNIENVFEFGEEFGSLLSGIGRRSDVQEGGDEIDSFRVVGSRVESFPEVCPVLRETLCSVSLSLFLDRFRSDWRVSLRGGFRFRPCSLELPLMSCDVENVEFVKFERREEGVFDVIHDLVEVGSGSESSRETEGSKRSRKLEESIVEFESSSEVRRRSNRVTWQKIELVSKLAFSLIRREDLDEPASGCSSSHFEL